MPKAPLPRAKIERHAFTENYLRALRARDDRYSVWCADTPGLGMRIYPSGREDAGGPGGAQGWRAPGPRHARPLPRHPPGGSPQAGRGSVRANRQRQEPERRSPDQRAADTFRVMCEQYINTELAGTAAGAGGGRHHPALGLAGAGARSARRVEAARRPVHLGDRVERRPRAPAARSASSDDREDRIAGAPGQDQERARALGRTPRHGRRARRVWLGRCRWPVRFAKSARPPGCVIAQSVSQPRPCAASASSSDVEIRAIWQAAAGCWALRAAGAAGATHRPAPRRIGAWRNGARSSGPLLDGPGGAVHRPAGQPRGAAGGRSPRVTRGATLGIAGALGSSPGTASALRKIMGTRRRNCCGCRTPRAGTYTIYGGRCARGCRSCGCRATLPSASSATRSEVWIRCTTCLLISTPSARR